MGLASLARKARLYGGEVAFAVTAPRTAAGSARLLAQAALMHWRNWRRRVPDLAATSELELEIGGVCRRLRLRPYAGDLGVLFEVLARQTYRIDPQALDPATIETVVDAGANVGISSLHLAARYPRARVYAIEPHPANLALLRHNTACEPRITVLGAALTARVGERVFMRGAGPAWGYRSSDDRRGIEVPGLTIGDLMREHGLTQIDLLKMDIEGAEKEIMADAPFLRCVGALIAELHGSYDLAAFNRDLAASGLAARVSPWGDDPHLVIALRDGLPFTAR